MPMRGGGGWAGLASWAGSRAFYAFSLCWAACWLQAGKKTQRQAKAGQGMARRRRRRKRKRRRHRQARPSQAGRTLACQTQ